MGYNVTISKRALREIEIAIEYYGLYSNVTPKRFLASLESAYNSLETDPVVLRIRYKNIRAIKLKGFPYLLYYMVVEQKNVVKILACFHNRRNPATLP